ncbi:MAG: hypothetical protein A3F54_04000 [Candidatus Kerfeldbacteria bacterium RIFCSPHIGHO2_12_FULL_48_17]|uniref:Single-stranded DNA-binding protein n=1 Tax=Candidatus Kerfeldbacteria bacterium RIFCSPHIGHO2_12_FULL_48_17 TaxID=1798542 RepID=A0A1G2B558_9BACT|nr:MAG: hypothetical protein A3F54_04000 [Candidatus Kerfeldbacteria bacterium RIFCSPHIGHO2_12_FULL_48_17]
MDLNKVMLIGRLTRDPESRTIPSGQTVTSFSIATSRQWKDQSGQKQEKTEFHNITAWRKLGEIAAQYLKKGKQIYLEGRLETHSWEDQGGVKKYRTEIVADNLIMLGSRQDGASVGAGGAGVASASSFAAAPAAAKPADQFAKAPAPTETAGGPEEVIRVEDIPF